MRILAGEIEQLHDKIFSWYAVHKRSLPWRDSFDPYKVMVSETMSQQTQVERVVPKFLARMQQVPNFVYLADLDKPTLLTLWSGLGFNSRAIRLQQAARIIMEEHGGEVPKDREQLIALPGIGPYTSASILAFAYDIDVPVVDTNIRRVLTYELGLPETLSPKELEAIATQCLPLGRSNDRHNALMDYGSLVATAKATGIKPTSKQSTFEGSPRQTRGRILKYLLEHDQAILSQLHILYPHEKFDDIIIGMVRDEIIQVDGDVVRVR